MNETKKETKYPTPKDFIGTSYESSKITHCYMMMGCANFVIVTEDNPTIAKIIPYMKAVEVFNEHT